jgi:hypothetical protein
MNQHAATTTAAPISAVYAGRPRVNLHASVPAPTATTNASGVNGYRGAAPT